VKTVIGLLILTGSSLSAQSSPARAVFAGVPEKLRSKANPEAKDRDAAQDGWRLFQQHCAQCHGASAEGGRVAPALINPVMHDAKPGEIFWLITNGIPDRGMPSWSKLPETERWEIVTFLQSRNALQGAASGEYGAPRQAFTKPSWQRPVFAHVPVKDRPKRNPLANDPDAPIAGLKLFQIHCSTCHGTGGEGTRRAPPLSNPQMQNATPGEVFWIVTNGLVRHGMPSWSRLPEQQRWQIVSFLRSLNDQQAPGRSTTPTRP
jgi:mono/diheme cytochrome c family protein